MAYLGYCFAEETIDGRSKPRVRRALQEWEERRQRVRIAMGSLQILDCGFIERLMKGGHELIRGSQCYASYRIVYTRKSLPVTVFFGRVLIYLRSESSPKFG